jgi:hypothetical protein
MLDEIGVLHQPAHANGDAILLTHGAGSRSDSPLLVLLADKFSEEGYLVLRYDLPFRRAGKSSPPPPSGQWRDRDGVRDAAAEMRKAVKGRVIAGGHSYGGRQTAMAAAENPSMADALLLFSYPLHAPATPERKRTDYFPQLRTPALFVHGAKDPFGSIEEMREALPLIAARTDLVEVPASGHDLKKAGGLSGEIAARLRKLL